MLINVVNASLSNGTVLSYSEKAVVISLLKKPSLDASVYRNYRPVSNLTVLGKTIETAD